MVTQLIIEKPEEQNYSATLLMCTEKMSTYFNVNKARHLILQKYLCKVISLYYQFDI